MSLFCDLIAFPDTVCLRRVRCESVNPSDGPIHQSQTSDSLSHSWIENVNNKQQCQCPSVFTSSVQCRQYRAEAAIDRFRSKSYVCFDSFAISSQLWDSICSSLVPIHLLKHAHTMTIINFVTYQNSGSVLLCQSWLLSQRCSLLSLLSCTSFLPAASCGMVTDPSSSQSHLFSSHIIYRSDSVHPPKSHVCRLLSRHSLNHAYSINLENLLLAWRAL